MKKLMFLAAAAIAVVACSKTYEAEPVSEQAIGFGTWAETLTKNEYRSAGSNTFLAGDTFNVYGYKVPSVGGKTTVFDGDVVTAYDASNGTSGGTVSNWKYSTATRFWDKDATNYVFYAASPSGILTTAPAQTGLFVTSEQTFGGHDSDILIATEKTVSNAEYSSDAVQIAFNHMASRIDIKVKMDASLNAASATVKVTAASLMAVRSKGTFTVKEYNATTKKPEGDTDASAKRYLGWTADATPTTANYASNATLPLTVTAYNAYTNHAAGEITNTPGDLFTNFILMPQDLNNGQTLQLTYTIETGTSPNVNTSTFANVNIPLKNFITTDKDDNSGTAITGWAPGKYYTYYVTIGANAITFTASINEWAEETGYNYLIQ